MCDEHRFQTNLKSRCDEDNVARMDSERVTTSQYNFFCFYILNIPLLQALIIAHIVITFFWASKEYIDIYWKHYSERIKTQNAETCYFSQQFRYFEFALPFSIDHKPMRAKINWRQWSRACSNEAAPPKKKKKYSSLCSITSGDSRLLTNVSSAQEAKRRHSSIHRHALPGHLRIQTPVVRTREILMMMTSTHHS